MKKPYKTYDSDSQISNGKAYIKQNKQLRYINVCLFNKSVSKRI